MQAALGQTIVVENIGGAGGSIAAKQVAIAPADGYTLMMTTTGSFGTMPRLYKLDYDPVKAFVPVATLVVDKGVLVAGPSWPVKTVQEMVAQAKAAPGKFNYGSAIGIGPHFVFELFKKQGGRRHRPRALSRRRADDHRSDRRPDPRHHQRQVGAAPAHRHRQGARARRHARRRAGTT